ncbi:MAG: PIN domain-containing protein [Anaerolineae bacterium]|nr:PIN domain-containing protein [Anaerolineae bacterium]
MEREPQLLVDTNLLIQHLRDQSGMSALRRSLRVYGPGAVSIISDIEYAAGELHVGRRPNFVEDFRGLRVLPLSPMILRRAPYLQAESIAKNHRMDMADLLIAATAIYHDLPLLTLNTDHFRHLDDLRLIKVR